MKIFLIFALCFISINGLPAKKDEVELVPPSRSSYGDQPIVDTGVIFPSTSSFDYLDGVMTRIRQQMEQLLKSFPVPSFLRGNETDVSDFPEVFPRPAFPPFDGLDLGKGNTTSVTKVIDGHKVVINETEYKKDDDFGGAYFKVRIIDVKPDSSELTTEADAEVTSSSTKDREPLENSVENEIEKSGEDIETFDETDLTEWKKTTTVASTMQTTFYNTEQTTEVLLNDMASTSLNEERITTVGEDVVDAATIKPFDLKNDTLVNDLLANQKINPDAEVFEIIKTPTVDSTKKHTNYENLESFEDDTVVPISKKSSPVIIADRNSEKYENLESFEDGLSAPIDLSKDVYVNEIMENQKLNPDAEVFFVPKPLEEIDNSIDSYYDLSRDTYVNNIAFNQGVPVNPDAEIFIPQNKASNFYEYKIQNSRDYFDLISDILWNTRVFNWFGGFIRI